MPQDPDPKCVQCDKTETLMWRTTECGQICQECYEHNTSNLKTELEPEEPEGNGKVRKSTRATRFKAKNGAATAATPGVSTRPTTKGRNRRNLFKKTPLKTPMVPATTHTVDSVFYKGSYLQIGDIVSLMDAKDNVYYAQIRGLLVDTYCEKSAYLTWLIPTQASPNPNERFDPSTYLIGPDEDHARNLSCLEFVMHAPSNYYHDKTTPFPPPDFMTTDLTPGGYIWTTLKEHERQPKTDTINS